MSLDGRTLPLKLCLPLPALSAPLLFLTTSFLLWASADSLVARADGNRLPAPPPRPLLPPPLILPLTLVVTLLPTAPLTLELAVDAVNLDEEEEDAPPPPALRPPTLLRPIPAAVPRAGGESLTLTFRAGGDPLLNRDGLGGPDVNTDDRRDRPVLLPPPPPARPLLAPAPPEDVLPVTLGRPHPKLPPPLLPLLVRGLRGAVDVEEAPLPEARVARTLSGRVGLLPPDGGRPARMVAGLLRLRRRVALPSSTWLTCGSCCCCRIFFLIYIYKIYSWIYGEADTV